MSVSDLLQVPADLSRYTFDSSWEGFQNWSGRNYADDKVHVSRWDLTLVTYNVTSYLPQIFHFLWDLTN